jgi:hypothetical protein
MRKEIEKWQKYLNKSTIIIDYVPASQNKRGYKLAY